MDNECSRAWREGSRSTATHGVHSHLFSPDLREVQISMAIDTVKELRVDRRSTGRRQLERREEATDYDDEDRRDTERREKVERRRQIDPTTCERDYSDDEIEFMREMDDYKRRSGRQFPTWSEVLEVLFSLGYRRVAEPSKLEF